MVTGMSGLVLRNVSGLRPDALPDFRQVAAAFVAVFAGSLHADCLAPNVVPRRRMRIAWAVVCWSAADRRSWRRFAIIWMTPFPPDIVCWSSIIPVTNNNGRNARGVSPLLKTLSKLPRGSKNGASRWNQRREKQWCRYFRPERAPYTAIGSFLDQIGAMASN